MVPSPAMSAVIHGGLSSPAVQGGRAAIRSRHGVVWHKFRSDKARAFGSCQRSRPNNQRPHPRKVGGVFLIKFREGLIKLLPLVSHWSSRLFFQPPLHRHARCSINRGVIAETEFLVQLTAPHVQLWLSVGALSLHSLIALTRAQNLQGVTMLSTLVALTKMLSA